MSNLTTLKIKKLSASAEMPKLASQGASGFDISASNEAAITILPGQRVKIPTGIAFELEPQMEAQVRPRSGLAWKHGVTVLNAPGTIDADYRGEVNILLINHGSEPFIVERGMRIAQIVVASVSHVSILECGEIGLTTRGDGGFGSTGLGALS